MRTFFHSFFIIFGIASLGLIISAIRDIIVQYKEEKTQNNKVKINPINICTLILSILGIIIIIYGLHVHFAALIQWLTFPEITIMEETMRFN